jgi:uncharacterized membrane protein YgcG
MRRLAVLALFVCALPLIARELHWDELSVEAHLDADGRLHVREKQVMVFTGDWNGGERKFSIRPRQALFLDGMSRVDAQSGEEIPLSQGSLDEVDHYGWTGRDILRWRSRRPSDPQFDRTPITYVLQYTLSNILQRDGEQYLLDHDFAFPERDGSIERVQVELTLDPVWQAAGGAHRSWSAGPLSPGFGYVVKVPLRYAGAGTPEAVTSGLPRPALGMLAALAFIPPLLLVLALLREAMLGRLDVVDPDDITRPWLERNVLGKRAEVIGAIWDDMVGAPEVAAVLARLVAEKKISSDVRGDVLHMSLLVPRAAFTGYERALIDGFFFGGDSTSTSEIRSHYEDKGFQPARLIHKELLAEVETQLPQGPKIRVWGFPLTLLFLAAAGAFAYAVYKRQDLLATSLFWFFGGAIASALALLGPTLWRRRKDFGIPRAIVLMVPALVAVGVAAVHLWRVNTLGLDEPLELQLAITLLAIWLFAAAVQNLRTRGESRESVAFRKTLAAAREHFRRELTRPQPSLDDAWYPYLLAFGLSRDVQRWFRQYPSQAHDRSTDWGASSTSSSSSSSSAASSSGWTGGGGAFGGAGSTGSWAAAASVMAVGVASASDSSSGGSGDSGGGSSGGGGGGGW